MKIVLTGGGTGGHFYPLVAIAERIKEVARERRLIEPRIYYIAPSKYDEQVLFENQIEFIQSPAGKLRRYASILNVLDIFVTATGFVWSLLMLYRLMPDVIISKGGYASVPTVLAGAVFGIPIIIHESDAKPGRANLFLAGFATRIGIAWESARAFFPAKLHDRIALIGIPLRKDLEHIDKDGARQYLGLEVGIPTILILGGSSGSRVINETILAALPSLISFSQIIHQTGEQAFKEIDGTARVVMGESEHATRYHPFAFLNMLALKRSAGIADIIISRAGSTAIAEIALWAKPAILIPIPESISHDQKTNAYTYAHTGAATVLEEQNLTSNLLVSEIKRILHNPELASDMSEKSKTFRYADAAAVIATEAIDIALSHEK